MDADTTPSGLDSFLRDPDEDLYRLISFTARDLRRALSEDFRAWGLTGAQFGVLLNAATRSNIGDIADGLLTDATSVGRMVERMEAAGLVERYREPPDRRIVWVRLQPRGEELLRELMPRHVQRCRELLGFLDDARRERLIALLGSIRDEVGTRRPPIDPYDNPGPAK
ncbi:MAG: MarR family transcriptional regulator [Dehalococcoidia bacterium]|nr:MarR family transcriptional regulator [Dehalococcoidia bacterium]